MSRAEIDNTIPYDDALILLVSSHIVIGIVTDSEDMGWQFTNLLILIQLNVL
jgi:hypothetical protein